MFHTKVWMSLYDKLQIIGVPKDLRHWNNSMLSKIVTLSDKIFLDGTLQRVLRGKGWQLQVTMHQWSG